MMMRKIQQNNLVLDLWLVAVDVVGYNSPASLVENILDWSRLLHLPSLHHRCLLVEHILFYDSPFACPFFVSCSESSLLKIDTDELLDVKSVDENGSAKDCEHLDHVHEQGMLHDHKIDMFHSQRNQIHHESSYDLHHQNHQASRQWNHERVPILAKSSCNSHPCLLLPCTVCHHNVRCQCWRASCQEKKDLKMSMKWNALHELVQTLCRSFSLLVLLCSPTCQSKTVKDCIHMWVLLVIWE